MADVRPLDLETCRIMVREMRAADRLEAEAMSGRKDLLSVLTPSIGEGFSGWHEGRLLCVYGVHKPTLLSSQGHPWMLGTDLMVEPAAQRVFARACRPILDGMTPPGVTRLWNVVHAENRQAIRWLKWLQFQFAPETFQHGGLNWRMFYKEVN